MRRDDRAGVLHGRPNRGSVREGEEALMAAPTIHVDVVSAEESIFSGEAEFVVLPGEAGELGIYPRHTPLITRIRPGAVRIQKPGGEEELVFVAGGILERSEEHTSELQSRLHLVCRLLLEKKNDQRARRP